MVFAVVLQFAGYMTVAQTARDNVQRVLDSYSMDKAREIYESSIRNGESGGAVLNQDKISSKILAELSLENVGGVLYNKNEDGRVVYTLSNLFISNLNDTSLRLQVRFDLTIPVAFSGRQISTLNIPMAVKSNYTPKT